MSTLRALGVNINYVTDGKFWAMRDGNAMLAPFGLRLSPAHQFLYGEPGRYVMLAGGHFQALRLHSVELYVRDFGLKRKTYMHYDGAAEFESDFSPTRCSFWRLLDIETSHATEK